MMELCVLLERLKMEHLLTQLDGVCEQAAKAISTIRTSWPQAWNPNGGAVSSGESKSDCGWRGSRG